MLFPTATFAIFFLIVLPLNWLLMPNAPRWRIFILAASYIFYGWWDWHYTLLLALSTVGNQFAARAINATESPRPRKLLLWVAILGNLGALGYFKYYDFFLSSAQNTLNEFGVDYTPTIIGVALPVGISFFTFQALSYVIDTYRGIVKPMSEARNVLRDHGVSIPEIDPTLDLPLLFHWGRQNNAVGFYGCKITPEDIQHVILRVPALASKVANFALHPYEDADANKRLELWLELENGVAMPDTTADLDAAVWRELAAVNQDFRESIKMIPAGRSPTLKLFEFGQSPMSGQDIRVKKQYIV